MHLQDSFWILEQHQNSPNYWLDYWSYFHHSVSLFSPDVVHLNCFLYIVILHPSLTLKDLRDAVKTGLNLEFLWIAEGIELFSEVWSSLNIRFKVVIV